MAHQQLGTRSAVAVLLRAVGGGFALGLATETTAEVEKLMLRAEGPLVAMAVRAAKLMGPSGVGAVLCCTGLAVAFLSAAAGVALGNEATVLMLRSGWAPHVTLGLVGVVVALGAVVGGAGLGAAVGALTTEGLTGILCLVLFGTEIAILFVPAVRLQARAGLKQMKMFLIQVFVTMFIGVVLGLLVADSTGGPVLGPVQGMVFAGLLLVLAATRLGAAAEKALGRLPGHRRQAGIFLGRLFGIIVAASGLLIGVVGGLSQQSGRAQLLMVAFLRSLVPVTLLLAGIIGAVLGTVTLGLADNATAEGVSVWLSTAVWVLLKALNLVVDQQPMLLGAGSMAGALLGAAGAAGLSLGAVGATAGKQFGGKGIALAVLGAAGGAAMGSVHKTMRTAAVTVVAALAPRLAGMEAVVRIHCEALERVRGIVGTQKGAVIGSAALGSATLGSAILGGLVLWTVAIGTKAHFAVLAVSIFTLITKY